MSVITRLETVEAKVDELSRGSGLHEEQINGVGGVVKAMDRLTDEVKSMKRAMWTVGGGVVLSAIGFALSILQQGAGG